MGTMKDDTVTLPHARSFDRCTHEDMYTYFHHRSSIRQGQGRDRTRNTRASKWGGHYQETTVPVVQTRSSLRSLDPTQPLVLQGSML